MDFIRFFFNSFIDSMFPSFCVLCGNSSAKIICPVCISLFEKLKPPQCKLCGIQIKSSETSSLCNKCKRAQPPYDLIRSLYIYDGYLKKTIIQYKYKKKKNISAILADLLVGFLREEPFINEVDYLLSVPLHISRQKTRGFNQSQLLASLIGKNLNIPVKENLIKRVLNTKSMNTLNREERFNNLKNAFYVINSSEIKDSVVLIVDDIVTTGATLHEISSLLKKNGARAVFCATVARTIEKCVPY